MTLPQHTSNSNEWYTPRHIIEMCREVLGGIDLDPASCEAANQVVRAERFFTNDDDGLATPWEARSIFCNPPYGWFDHQGGTSNLAVWTRRALDEYASGRFEEGILLVKAATGTKWFGPLWDHSLCFPDSRISFWKMEGGSGAPHDSALAYLGEHPGKFVKVFKKIGRCVLHVTPAQQQQLFAA